MLHEWRSPVAATTSAMNYLILSKAQDGLQLESLPLTKYLLQFDGSGYPISDIRKFLIGILKFHGLGLWCFTLWCFVSHLSLSLPPYFSQEKKLFNFLYTNDALRRLHTSEWRVEITFFCRLTIQATCICDNFNGAKSRNEMLRYYCYGTK